MCGSEQATSSGRALAAVDAGLSWLATADMVALTTEEQVALTTEEQADCLRALERAESRLTAVRAAVLSAFDTTCGYEADAARGSVSWLRWQTRVTGTTATAAAGWMRRLRAHPAVAGVLARGDISASWARQLCEWSDTLPEDDRAGADQILLAAAGDGCELADISRLAEEMYRRCAPPDTDPEDENFTARNVRLTRHFRGHGKLDGDLTPECGAALQAVLDALGQRAGPEDRRSPGQRRHDALQEACRRLIAAGGLPDRAGQPTQIQLHMTLQQLLCLDGAAEAIAGWPVAGPGWDCDASISPIVTGTLDADLLDQLASLLLGDLRGGAQPGTDDSQQGTSAQASTDGSRPGTSHDGMAAGQDEIWPHDSSPDTGHSGSAPDDTATADSGSSDSRSSDSDPSEPAPDDRAPDDTGLSDSAPHDSAPATGHRDSAPDDRAPDDTGLSDSAPHDSAPDDTGLSDSEPSEPATGGAAARDRDTCPADSCHQRTKTAARQLIMDRATRLLCGPSGLAAYLRTQLLPQPAASMSLPLDVGRPTEVIPPHLRRAILTRDRHCAFPGCNQPPAGCQVHHVIPRSQGGTTSLHNCYLLCTFHHLIAVHTWGWQLRPNPDGTLTASNPYRSYTSHSPPASAA